MLLDPALFEFASPLLAAWPALSDELAMLSVDQFCPWPDRAAYQGVWLVYPLLVLHPHPELDVDCERNRQRCPRSVAALARVPRLATAAFSWLEPGTHIFPHRDADHANVIRAQLGLRIPDGARLRVAGQVHEWRVGSITAFDGQLTHEVANLGALPRVVFLVDYVMTPEERSSFESARTAPT